MQTKIGRVIDCICLSGNSRLSAYAYKYFNISQINKNISGEGEFMFLSVYFVHAGQVEEKFHIVQVDYESFARVIPKYFSSFSGQKILIERSKAFYNIQTCHYDTEGDKSGMADTDIGINNNDNGMSGNSSDIPANDNSSSEIVSGTSVDVTGNLKKVDGNSETITGTPATIFGTYATIIGISMIIYGSSEIAIGSSEIVDGNSEIVYGTSIEATGTSENVTSMPEIVIGTPVYVNGMSTVKIGFYKGIIILYVTNIEIPIEK
jgi:hypothetical protein